MNYFYRRDLILSPQIKFWLIRLTLGPKVFPKLNPNRKYQTHLITRQTNSFQAGILKTINVAQSDKQEQAIKCQNVVQISEERRLNSRK